MKHLILGTAGHVDHGKTALVRALTGIECDTHGEEKARGITINLGFAHLDLPPSISYGIVDVPGHRDFVHTMVSGASGIDVALLVVAADSGVMPQTREHLQIMDILGIHTGVVALSKVDLIDGETAEIAEEEVRDLLAGTFLANAPVVRVSAVTGEGLDTLKNTLGTIGESRGDTAGGDVFRLFPDRFFSVSGFGTIVTGSALGGSIKNGDNAFLLPGGQKLRVRRLERHGVEVESIACGDRASLNLVGLKREDFQRGMAISDRLLRHTDMVDAHLTLFEGARPFGIWNHAVFHLGTYENAARIHVIDADTVEPGDGAFAQIHLAGPCVVQPGDRFVLRSTSSDITLGGGEILDPFPLHHRRRTEKVIAAMQRVLDGGLLELIAVELVKSRGAMDAGELAAALNISDREVKNTLSSRRADIATYKYDTRLLLIHESVKSQWTERIFSILEEHHRQHPLDSTGRKTEELLGMLGIQKSSSSDLALRHILEELAEESKIARSAATWVLHGHVVNLTPEEEEHIRFVENFLVAGEMAIPSISALKNTAKERRLSGEDVDQFLRYLVDNGRAYHADGEYLHASLVDRCRMQLLENISENKKGMSVAEFRDLVRGNRKICLIMLGIFDGEAITTRVGDVREITNKGKKMFREKKARPE